MRSVRSNTNKASGMGDPGNNYCIDDASRVTNYQVHSSSEDEDELTQLKPNLHSQKLKQSHKNPKKAAASKKNYNGSRFQESDSHVPDVNSHNFIIGNGQYEGTLSPNEGENAYAEASLLPTSMANPIIRQDNRYEQGILQYDSELYANGINDTCGNDGYGKDGNSSSGSGRYQIPHQITHGLISNRSPQHSERNGVHDASQNYSTANDVVSLSKSPFLSSSTNSSRTNGRSSSSMASSTNKRASGRDVTGFGRKDFQNPPMLPSDPPGTRRQQQLQSGLGGQMVVDKNWDYISGANTLGGDYLKYNQHIPNSATLVASDRRTQNSMVTKGNVLHRRSLSDESFGMEGSSHAKQLMSSPSNTRGIVQHTHLSGAVTNSMGGGDPILGVEQTVVMPGFPVRTLQHHPPPPYSPSREKFVIGRKCRFHCSWKFVALGLTALTLILSSVIAYFGAVTFHPRDPATIPTGKLSETHAADFVQESQLLLPASDSAISHSPGTISNPDCIPVGDVVRMTQHSGGNRQPQAVLPANLDYVPSGESSSSYRNNFRISTQSPMKNIPTTNLILGQWYNANIEPLSFWRAQLTVQQSSQNFEMNLTFVGTSSGMGLNEKSNVAIYGRRSDPPTITNYDWVHMISETGNVKNVVKRSVDDDMLDELSEEDLIIRTHRDERSVGRSRGDIVTVTKPLSRGDWYIGVFNDDSNARTIRAVIGKQRRGSRCPKKCSSHGTCDDGKCRCSPQYSGTDCSKSICPLLCSGHGVYAGGQCHCVDGWKGRECELVETECIDPSCNGHGRCREGVCICSAGWTGESCDIRDCYDKKCSGHGICQNAQCICDIGWIGRNCERRNSVLMQCLPDCSSHGDFDVESGKCNCHDRWTGRECNITLCSLDCGQHGQCQGSGCVCQEGWEGKRCQHRSCDARCSMHGQCKNGSCICQTGFNGKHCSLPACNPVGVTQGSLCSGHGTCESTLTQDSINNNRGNKRTIEDNQNIEQMTNLFTSTDFNRPEYRCICEDGWSGDFCHVEEEVDCEDGVDNDNNGLTDCGDSKCCSHPSCKNNIMCMYLADPVDVLLRKPPPTVAASFLSRVRFLFEGEESVQNYAKLDTFDDNRVSIIRGRVVTMKGQGIIGVRVSVDRTKDSTNYGFTLTRPGGWFDMAVNGGGGVTLQFQRSPLKAITRTTFLPWNQIVIINPVIMTPVGAGISWNEEDTSLKVRYFQPCLSHDYETMKPIISSPHSPTVSSAHVPTNPPGGIIPELNIARESIDIPGSNVHLMYRSSYSVGAMSTLNIRLTPHKIPQSLHQIHLIIKVSGLLTRKTFEADKNLYYTFSWNRKNAYNQKVYGFVEADISVGYHYENCDQPIWITRNNRMKGFDVDISYIGGWNLDIHHHYNHFQGILQKGDGSVIEFSSYPRLLSHVIGSGKKRPFQCSKSSGQNGCDGTLALNSDLMNVVSLTSGPDGSIYIGDYNLIRRVLPDTGKIHTILEFESMQGSYEYDMKISPADNMLYLSVPQKYQVWRVEALDPRDVGDPKLNKITVAGNGERCIPGDTTDQCGDNGLAVNARLNFPKGIAIAVDKTMYISDGRNIRVITPDGKIRTLIGNHGRVTGPPRPIPCIQRSNQRRNNVLLAGDMQLQWPTRLAINPLDSTLHIVDDSVILRLTPDMRINVVAGVSPLCPIVRAERDEDNSKANLTPLGPITDVVFSFDGKLYLTERRPRNGSKLYVIDSDGAISEPDVIFNNNQSCIDHSEKCNYGLVSAVAVTPNNTILLADNNMLKIQKLDHFQPSLQEGQIHRVVDPIMRRLYEFNRFSQHIATYNLDTNGVLYSFEYSKNTVLGRLTKVTDPLGNKLSLKRDYTNRVKTLENTFGQKYEVQMSQPAGLLAAVEDVNGNQIRIDYDGDESGLLQSKRMDNGDFTIYKYDEYGRAIETVLSSGDVYNVFVDNNNCPINSASLADPGMCLRILHNGVTVQLIEVKNSGTIKIQNENCPMTISHSGSVWKGTSEKCSLMSSTDTKPHPTLQHMDPLLFQIQQTPSNLGQMTGRKGALELEWKYENKGYPVVQIMNSKAVIYKRLKAKYLKQVQPVLEVGYNAETEEERFLDRNGQEMLSILHKNGLLTNQWSSHANMNCSQRYDRIHRLVHRQCGTMEESLKYSGRNGRIEEWSRCQKRPMKYAYGNGALPQNIILPSGIHYHYEYDESGGLSKIRLPGGMGTHVTSTQLGLFGVVKFYHLLPGYTEPFVLHYTEDGKLLSIRKPYTQSPSVLYRYDESHKKLKSIVSGDSETSFKYSSNEKESTEYWSKDVDHKTYTDFKINTKYLMSYAEFENQKKLEDDYDVNSHNNKSMLTAELRITFNPVSGYASAKFSYSFSRGLLHPLIEGRIGGQILPNHFVQHSWSPYPSVNDMGKFTIHPLNINETTVSDGIATFSRSETSESLLISGRKLYFAEYILDACGRIETARHQLTKPTNSIPGSSWSSDDSTVIHKYKYDEDGQIIGSILDRNVESRIEYDSVGNMISYTTTKRLKRVVNKKFEYKDGRLLKHTNNQKYFVEYDDNGRVVVDRKQQHFTYSSGDLLTKVQYQNLKVFYHYDHLGRMVGRKDSIENSTQYFYAFPNKPYLISHVYNNRDGMLVSLVYDDEDRLIFSRINDRKYYVVTDRIGSPIYFLTPTGKVVREIERNLYGEIIRDSDPQFPVQIGFSGAIYDKITLLTHVQGPDGSRAYNAFTGTFLTPAWKEMSRNVLDPLRLRLYRYPYNDPINNRRKLAFRDPKMLLSEIESNLQLAFPNYDIGFWKQSNNFPFYNLDSEANFGGFGGIPSSSIPFPLATKQTSITGYRNRNFARKQVVESAAKLNLEHALASAARIPAIQNSDLLFKPQMDRLSFSKTDSPLGKFVTLSLLTALSDDGEPTRRQHIQLNSINAGTINEVPRGIFKSVLSGATLTDFRTVTKSGEESYYFVKEQIAQSTEDIRALHRLGPRVNLTTHDTQTDNSLTMDVKVHLDNTQINIRYGTNVEAEKNRLLRHAYKILTRRAWAKEKELILAEEKLLGDNSEIQLTNFPWNATQRKQLLRKGSVDGFDIMFKREVQKYTELANSLDNVRFIPRKRQNQKRKGS